MKHKYMSSTCGFVSSKIRSSPITFTVLAISQNILHIHPYIKIVAVMGLVARSY